MSNVLVRPFWRVLLDWERRAGGRAIVTSSLSRIRKAEKGNGVQCKARSSVRAYSFEERSCRHLEGSRILSVWKGVDVVCGALFFLAMSSLCS